MNWVELGGAVLGVLVAVRALTDWHAMVAPVWLVTTALAVLLSSVPEASYRLAVALPALAILAAVGWVAIGRWTISLLPRPVAVPVVVAIGLAVLAYDASINGARVLRYLHRMDHAEELTTLGREIASGPPAAVYYVVAPPGQVEHRVFLGLTHNRTVVAVTNLSAEVPRDVDPHRPAVFVVPSGDASALAYWRNLYGNATVREIRDPSGFFAGHTVSAEPRAGSGAAAQRAADGADQLVHPHRAVAVGIGGGAARDGGAPERNVDRRDQLGDRDAQIAAAVTRTGDRRGRLRGGRRRGLCCRGLRGVAG